MYPHKFEHNSNTSKSHSNPSRSLSSNQDYQNRQSIPTLQNFVAEYNINSIFAKKLEGLRGYEIVFICDDSGSMNTPLYNVSGYRKQQTRWDELKQTVSIVVDIASVLDPDGVDIYFLNRPPIFNVRHSKALTTEFAVPPAGGTPLVSTLRRVIRDKHKQIAEERLLILIATDGEPTDESGRVNIEEFRHVLEHERIPIGHVPVSIIACTEDDMSMQYLDEWDTKIDNLDVVDDYKSEKEQILQIQGPNFPFSFGDYVVKILMGAIDKWFDLLDEKPVSLNIYGPTQMPRSSPKNSHKSPLSSLR